MTMRWNNGFIVCDRSKMRQEILLRSRKSKLFRERKLLIFY